MVTPVLSEEADPSKEKAESSSIVLSKPALATGFVVSVLWVWSSVESPLESPSESLVGCEVVRLIVSALAIGFYFVLVFRSYAGGVKGEQAPQYQFPKIQEMIKEGWKAQVAE